MNNANNNNCNVAILTEDNNILLHGHTLTRAEARELSIRLNALLKESDVTDYRRARFVPINIAKDLFDSVDDGTAFTVHIEDEKYLDDIRAAFNVEEILDCVDALMKQHGNNDSLNIMFENSTGDDYANSTMSFAQSVAGRTQEFLKIRCLYDQKTRTLGVFCRKNEADISLTFRGHLCNELITKGHCEFDHINIPDTYLQYPSMLLYNIRKKLPELKIELKKKKNSFRFTAKKVAI